MAITAFSTISLLVFVLCLQSTYGDDGGWVTGHATFYGGGDASGTMGKFKRLFATTFTFNFLTYLFMYNFLKLHLFLDTKIHQSTFNKYTNKLHLLEFLFLEEKSWEQVKVG